MDGPRRSARTAARAAPDAAAAPASPTNTATVNGIKTTTTKIIKAPKPSKPVTSTRRTPRPAPPSKPSAKAPSTKQTAPPTSLPILPFATPEAFAAHISSIPPSPPPPGLWLQISKKSSGIPSVTYETALDVALCHGWIDGQRRPYDDLYFLQRFTPRRRNSTWSRRNVDKIATLTAAGRMTPAGQAEVDAAKADGRWERAYAGASTIGIPADLEEALRGDAAAREAFEALSKTLRYPILLRIEMAKKPETRTRKIEETLVILKEGKVLPGVRG